MRKQTLLVADDVEMNRTVIKKFLKSEFEIAEASDGLEILEVLQERKVDAILLDIIMPEMNGLEVLKKIREKREWDTIGILVATSAKEKTEREALDAGADDVVAKPYDPIVIKQRLKNIMAKKEMECELSRKAEGDAVNHPLDREQQTQILDAIKIIEKASALIESNAENAGLIKEFSKRIKEQADIVVKTITTDQGE